MDDINSYYQLLGLESGASLEEVKKAYRDSMKIWTDRRLSPEPQIRSEAQEKIKEINTAYEKIKTHLWNVHKQNLDLEKPNSKPPLIKLFFTFKMFLYLGVFLMFLSISYYYFFYKPNQERLHKEIQERAIKQQEDERKRLEAEKFISEMEEDLKIKALSNPIYWKSLTIAPLDNLNCVLETSWINGYLRYIFTVSPYNHKIKYAREIDPYHRNSFFITMLDKNGFKLLEIKIPLIAMSEVVNGKGQIVFSENRSEIACPRDKYETFSRWTIEWNF